MEFDTEDQVLLSLLVMRLIMDFDSRVGQLVWTFFFDGFPKENLVPIEIVNMV